MNNVAELGSRRNPAARPRATDHTSRYLRNTDSLPHPPVNIGPGSLIWEQLGDLRVYLTGMSAGIKQLMHPTIGRAVSEHSDFKNDPWGRINRSFPEIIGAVYDPNGRETGNRIRRLHNKIQGVDEQGNAYHALTPEPFGWAHDTFYTMVDDKNARFDWQPFSPRQKEQLHREMNTWYMRYGVSPRWLLPDYASFRARHQDITDNVLTLTPAANN